MRRLLRKIPLYAFHILFVRPVLRWVAGVRYRRRHLVPAGPCLVVSNHNSHLDAAVLMTLFPLGRLGRVHPVAAADYFGSNWFMRMMAMLLMNGIPIERRPTRGEDPLAPITELLKAGKTLVFFPEGSRGEAGVVAKFRTGVGRLVQAVPGLLVVPVYLSGPERIWPRGELVPVPLNVDVIVGKPRSYTPRDDPREIAEQVRRDVLALAPPPPPVPGERALPPVRVALCGIDDLLVRDVFLRVTERLGRRGATLGISEPVLEADGAAPREVTGPLPVGRERAWLATLGTLFRTGPRYGGRRFADLVERSRINEALTQGHDTRYVVEQGSVIADLVASAVADLDPPPGERELRDMLAYLVGEKKQALSRSWRLLRGAPAIWLMNTFNLSRTPVPELLVHLTLPPSSVMKRLRSSGAELLAFQTEAGLDRLQQAYRRVAEMLRRRRKVDVLELEMSETDPESAALRIEASCRELSGSNNAAPGS